MLLLLQLLLQDLKHLRLHALPSPPPGKTQRPETVSQPPPPKTPTPAPTCVVALLALLCHHHGVTQEMSRCQAAGQILQLGTAHNRQGRERGEWKCSTIRAGNVLCRDQLLSSDGTARPGTPAGVMLHCLQTKTDCSTHCAHKQR
jgi:hypothetical protein